MAGSADVAPLSALTCVSKRLPYENVASVPSLLRTGMIEGTRKVMAAKFDPDADGLSCMTSSRSAFCYAAVRTATAVDAR